MTSHHASTRHDGSYPPLRIAINAADRPWARCAGSRNSSHPSLQTGLCSPWSTNGVAAVWQYPPPDHPRRSNFVV